MNIQYWFKLIITALLFLPVFHNHLTYAASHNEAPLIDFDHKADINNVFVFPTPLPTPSSGNQVNVVGGNQISVTNNNVSTNFENLTQATNATETATTTSTIKNGLETPIKIDPNYATRHISGNNARDLGRIVEIRPRSGSENQIGRNVQVSRLSNPLISEASSSLQANASETDEGSSQPTTSTDSKETKPISKDQAEQSMNSGTFDVPSVDSLSIHVVDKEFLVVPSTNSTVNDSIGREGPIHITTSQFFSSIQNGQAKAPEGFQAGGPMSVIVQGTEGISDTQVLMTLTSADGEENVQVSGALNEDVGAGIFGNRHVASFMLPYDLTSGFYDFSLGLGSQSTTPVQIQIADSATLIRQRELVQIVQASLNEKYAFPYALVGPYSPLPLGAKVHDPNTGELITTIDQDNTWLFFAYDPDAFFGQPDARWILINGNSEDMQIIENREFWPEVITADGEAYPFDFGSHDHVYFGLFNAGPYFQYHNTGEDTTPEKKDETDSTEEDSDSIGPAIIGLSSTLKDCPPEEIKKYAFILTFDDTDKRFIELKNDEKKLLKKLGISAANIHRTRPKRFPHGQEDI